MSFKKIALLTMVVVLLFVCLVAFGCKPKPPVDETVQPEVDTTEVVVPQQDTLVAPEVQTTP